MISLRLGCLVACNRDREGGLRLLCERAMTSSAEAELAARNERV